MPLLAQMLGKRAAGVQVDVLMGNSADIAKPHSFPLILG